MKARFALRLVLVLLFFIRTAPLFCADATHVIRVGFFPNVTHAQALVAKNMSGEDKGWFESRLGAKIEWYAFNAGPSAMESIFARSIDLTYVGPSPAINAYSRSHGTEMRVLSGAMKGGAALVVRGEEIKDAKDLKGKTIATPQLGNTQDVECRAWLLEHGIKVTLTGGDARVLPTANPDIIALFQQGKIDSAWTVEPWVSRLVNEFGGRILHQDNDTTTTILVARAAYLSEQADLVKKFVAAHKELTEWIKANPDEAQRRIRAELNAITRSDISGEIVKESWSRLIPENAISIEPFEKFQERAKEAGLLKTKANLSNFIYSSP